MECKKYCGFTYISQPSIDFLLQFFFITERQKFHQTMCENQSRTNASGTKRPFSRQGLRTVSPHVSRLWGGGGGGGGGGTLPFILLHCFIAPFWQDVYQRPRPHCPRDHSRLGCAPINVSPPPPQCKAAAKHLTFVAKYLPAVFWRIWMQYLNVSAFLTQLQPLSPEVYQCLEKGTRGINRRIAGNRAAVSCLCQELQAGNHLQFSGWDCWCCISPMHTSHEIWLESYTVNEWILSTPEKLSVLFLAISPSISVLDCHRTKINSKSLTRRRFCVLGPPSHMRGTVDCPSVQNARCRRPKTRLHCPAKYVNKNSKRSFMKTKKRNSDWRFPSHLLVRLLLLEGQEIHRSRQVAADSRKLSMRKLQNSQESKTTRKVCSIRQCFQGWFLHERQA